MRNLRTSDVISYTPATKDSRRTGVAIVDTPGVHAYDTYSGVFLQHERLSRAEFESAVVLFNVDDMTELSDEERHIFEVARPENRGSFPAGDGRIRRFVRREVLPDPGVELLNATRELRAAKDAVDAAQERVAALTNDLFANGTNA